jgi:hypothetical protein
MADKRTIENKHTKRNKENEEDVYSTSHQGAQD